jgi:hypothetical protein
MPRQPVIHFDVIMDRVAKLPLTIKNIEGQAAATFEPKKEQFLEAIENSDVSQEIEAGSDGEGAENISGTLEGKGDLFSFIGFDRGTHPVQYFINFLRYTIQTSRITRVNKTSRNTRRFVFNVIVPTKDEITQETQIPWNPGRSWVYGIEQGISGFGLYLAKSMLRTGNDKLREHLEEIIDEHSHSGQALQMKLRRGGSGRPGRFHSVSYFSPLFAAFKKSVSR